MLALRSSARILRILRGAPSESSWSGQPAIAQLCGHSHRRRLCTDGQVEVVFIERGEEVCVSAPEGKTLLEVAHANDVDLEGACDGSLACSTCHVILEQHVFDKLPPPDEDELDMLDLAFDLKATSRLGCQIKLQKELAGMRATIPDGI
mmetsp:Transcript_509/g.1122  ORF Transcript_509/g.1122 Transcript_509/m.1122 type:complete len:149 (-) Transcript_509:185-631(-)